MKKLLAVLLVVATLAASAAFSAGARTSASSDNANDVVGVWEVDAAAPYRPHLFTFHEDGTMTTTNPTNVQEDAGALHNGTNDSLGMGVWKTVRQHNQTFVV